MPPMRVEPVQTIYELLKEECWVQAGKYTYYSPGGHLSITVHYSDINDTVIVEFLLEDWMAAGAEALARKLKDRLT